MGTRDSYVFFCDLYRSKDRQDEAMRNNFEKMKLYSSVPNTYTMDQGLLLVIPTTVGNTAEASFKENPWSQAHGS